MTTANGAHRGGIVREVRSHFAERRGVVIGLMVLMLLAYGFQLFNFNLTIDEEIQGATFDPTQWVSSRRWGMFVLNRLVLPFTVVPVVPLALALTFHFCAVLLLLKAWSVREPGDQLLVGSLAIATPTLAYMYTFDVISFGIGAGLLATALSLEMFQRFSGRRRLLAAIPGGFALAIYPTLGLALIGVYLVSLVRATASGSTGQGRTLAEMVTVGVAAWAVYLGGQALAMATLNEARSGYIDLYFDLGALRDRPVAVAKAVARRVLDVYRGDATVYSHLAWALPILIAMLFVSVAWKARRLGGSVIRRLALVASFPLVLLLPFAGGVLSGGYIALRFLVAVPFALAGAMVLAIPAGRLRSVVYVLTVMTLLQFVTATNSLFGSSHLALQRDRALATRVIHEIEVASGSSPVIPRYFEVVGVPTFVSTELIHRSETFGASFFEWEQGDACRILYFFRTLGFHDLTAMSSDQRALLVPVTDQMRQFPAPGSVIVSGDVVIVRFGPYTDTQRAELGSPVPLPANCDA